MNSDEEVRFLSKLRALEDQNSIEGFQVFSSACKMKARKKTSYLRGIN